MAGWDLVSFESDHHTLILEYGDAKSRFQKPISLIVIYKILLFFYVVLL